MGGKSFPGTGLTSWRNGKKPRVARAQGEEEEWVGGGKVERSGRQDVPGLAVRVWKGLFSEMPLEGD